MTDEGLSLCGIVADIRDYIPFNSFYIIVIDRTLHMLKRLSDRIPVLERCAQSLNGGGHLLIADERLNMPDFIDIFECGGRQWEFL